MKELKGIPAPDDPEAALAAVVALRRRATQLELAAVIEAVRQGWTWAQIGEALGISAQAAHKKFTPQLREPQGR
ncbi:helix-turn-helix domain-containing protein [Corallococcus sicarius]|uniref:Helix-turn-helix domain-containing protein n=1 Tax=Corallococcus sicarius TaxID=2316726 RepID=A0A3A8NNN0_9BACT|nr:helix-turn-helix domain-containing protein [Corallococcus sicarius]RKH45997.1 helix-turn-helix domain-containing protein [Corallococcus sicarius]